MSADEIDQLDGLLPLHHPTIIDALRYRQCAENTCPHDEACPTQQVLVCNHCMVDSVGEFSGISLAVDWPCRYAGTNEPQIDDQVNG